jgi:hypothetical protein
MARKPVILPARNKLLRPAFSPTRILWQNVIGGSPYGTE